MSKLKQTTQFTNILMGFEAKANLNLFIFIKCTKSRYLCFGLILEKWKEKPKKNRKSSVGLLSTVEFIKQCTYRLIPALLFVV